tara:strand:+ start:77 stop:367 length:291 start_codon:yes stop_codon:yes gene_type:complete
VGDLIFIIVKHKGEIIMKSIKYILVLLILTSSVYSRCFICGVVPQEWNIHMASNEYADEIKKKKKKKGKKLKNKAKGKKGGAWGTWKSKWKKKKES